MSNELACSLPRLTKSHSASLQSPSERICIFIDAARVGFFAAGNITAATGYGDWRASGYLPSFPSCPNIPTPFASSLSPPLPLDFPNEIRACDGPHKNVRSTSLS